MDLVMLAAIVAITALTATLVAVCHRLEGRQHGR